MTDIVLTVRYEEKASTLSYSLDVRNPKLGVVTEEDIEQHLSRNLSVVLDALLSDIEPSEAPVEANPGVPLTDNQKAAIRRHEGIGEQLFEELVPEKLRQRLQGLPEDTTLQIQSNETLIPWELLRMPGDPGAFLAERFRLTRWLLGCEQTTKLLLKQIALVTSREPGLLPYAQAEHDSISNLDRPNHRVTEVEASYSAVMATLDAGAHDGFHFTGHGVAFSDDPNASGLVLDDRKTITSYEIRKAKGLRTARPLIFANACHSGRGGHGITRMGGLSRTFLDAGAGAYVGSHWALDDAPPAAFSCAFYEGILNGLPIAEAVRRARLAIRDRFPGHPTWLAYTVFANPLASCEAAKTEDAPPEPEPPKLPPPRPFPIRPIRRLSVAGRRWLAVAAVALLPVLLLVLGKKTHESRETMLRISDLSYPTMELLGTGTEAVGALFVNGLTPLWSSHSELRTSAWILLLLALLGLLSWRWQRRWSFAGYLALTLAPLVLWVGIHLYTFALRARHPEERPGDTSVLCSDYIINNPPTITEQIVYESCSWLNHPTPTNEEWRQNLSGLIAYFLLASGVILWVGVLMGRGRGWREVARLTLLGANVLVLLLILRQFPLAHAYYHWGLEYPTATLTDAESALAKAIDAGICCAYDVTEGANETVLFLWGECPSRPEHRWKGAKPSFELGIEHVVTRPCVPTKS